MIRSVICVMRRAQIWSMDLAVGVIVFLLVIGIVFFFLNSQQERNRSRLRIESQLVADRLTGLHDLSFVSQGQINESVLAKLVNMSETDYATLRSSLGLRDDFCVLFVDGQENIIFLSSHNASGFGNANLTFNLTAIGPSGRLLSCGETY